MRCWIPTIDVIVFAAFPAVITAAIGTSLFFEQAWPAPKIVLAIVVPLAAWLIFGLLLWSKWRRRPTFITILGTAVWCNGLDIDSGRLIDAINLYSTTVARAHKRLELQAVLAMFSRMRIEFTRDHVWWVGEKKAGLQQGYAIRVRWGDGFGYNALFHEMHHAIDENLLGVPVDYQHKRLAWWDMIPKIKRSWREGASSVCSR